MSLSAVAGLCCCCKCTAITNTPKAWKDQISWLLLGAGKNKNVSLGASSDRSKCAWAHPFPFLYRVVKTYSKEFAITHNIHVFCAAEYCFSSASSQHNLKQLWGYYTLWWIVWGCRIVTADSKCCATLFGCNCQMGQNFMCFTLSCKKKQLAYKAHGGGGLPAFRLNVFWIHFILLSLTSLPWIRLLLH